MTDHLPPLSDDDLSAALDGEAAPEIVARIAADPEAQRRSDELARAAAAVGADPEPLEAAAVEDLIAAALATPLGEADGSTDEADGEVVPMAPARSRRGRSGTPRILAAAAIAVVLAIGVALVWSGTSGNGSRQDAAVKTADEAATSGGDASSGAGTDGMAESADDAPQAPTAGPATDSQADTSLTKALESLPDLGTFDDATDFRSAGTAAFAFDADDGGANRTTQKATDRCATFVQESVDLKAGPTKRAKATIAGEVVLVYEFAVPAEDGRAAATLIAAVRPVACDPVVIFQR